MQKIYNPEANRWESWRKLASLLRNLSGIQLHIG